MCTINKVSLSLVIKQRNISLQYTYKDIFTFLSSAAQKSLLLAKKLATIKESIFGKLQLLPLMNPVSIVIKIVKYRCCMKLLLRNVFTGDTF